MPLILLLFYVIGISFIDILIYFIDLWNHA